MKGYATRDYNAHTDGPETSVSTELERRLLRRLMKALGNPSISVELWDGYVDRGPQTASHGEIIVRFHDRGVLYRMLYKPSYTFGILFTAGRVSIRGDLVQALIEIYQGTDKVRHSGGVLRRMSRRLAARRRDTNSLQGSKENIHSHYDLGNEFYELWLDRDYTQYTCAYFPMPEMSLEQAQAAKLELVCRKLSLQPGERVVEAGSGWGGLALYLAQKYGVKVRSYNISSEQVAWADKRVREAGLQDRVEYVEDDYRNIRGSFDAFVSVGMLEHVGPDHFSTLGATIDRCLTDEGRGLIHTIGQLTPRRMNEWIETYIFPGAEPPTLGQMMTIFEPQQLAVVDVENLRSHYACTLRHWSERFEANSNAVEEMFDAAFVRAWRLYLSGSTAAFIKGRLQLFQVVFQRPACSLLPATRAHLFAPGLIPDSSEIAAAP